MMMNAFMEPSAPTHPHHLAQYGLKMSPPLQASSQDNLNGGMLGAVAADHNAVGIANNSAYQASSYGPSAATAPYTSYGRDYFLKREQDYLGMPATAANPAAPAESMLFPGIHHTHAMHDNQFASYHQHQMRMGITSGSVGSATASVPQAAGKFEPFLWSEIVTESAERFMEVEGRAGNDLEVPQIASKALESPQSPSNHVKVPQFSSKFTQITSNLFEVPRDLKFLQSSTLRRTKNVECFRGNKNSLKKCPKNIFLYQKKINNQLLSQIPRQQ